MPRFILFVRATPLNESNTLPTTIVDELQRMATFNASLADAGVLLAVDGFLPSSTGARVHFSSSPGAKPTVIRGPFDVLTVVSGYWVIQVANLDEAVSWAKKVPFRRDDEVVEVRQIEDAENLEGRIKEATERGVKG